MTKLHEDLSKSIIAQLLEAVSTNDVKKVLTSSPATPLFKDDKNWQPYGNREKNWDIIGNQQSNGAGAFTELVVNAQDSVLIRKARESGIDDLRGKDVPQSMFEAVGTFFNHVVEGKIQNLSAKQLTDLAEKTTVVGVKRSSKKTRFPTYTIVDRGEGQRPKDFPITFLSLSQRNKEGVPFVQGKFNMGSTGSLSFCTKGERRNGLYKLIVSKPYDDPESPWGWTLIRVRGPRGQESLPVTEYFFPGEIPKFSSGPIGIFEEAGERPVESGSIIKLYDYYIGEPYHNVDLGLDQGLMTNLINCALPIKLLDFDAEPVLNKGDLRAKGIAARTFGGLSLYLGNSADDSDSEDKEIAAKPDGKKPLEFVHHVTTDETGDLGSVKILVTGMSKLPKWLLRNPARIFYTVNGQRQAFERASFLNSSKVKLGDLRNHLIVDVQCDAMEKDALTDIFMPDRERKKNGRLAKKLEELVVNSLKNDSKLKQYVNIIRQRRASAHVEDDEATKNLMDELVKADPSIRELFGLGSVVLDTTKVTGGGIPFKGKKFPTFLDPLNLKKDGEHWIKELPVGNSLRRVQCGTDASNDYLSRSKDPGSILCSVPADQLERNLSLHNGTLSFSLKAPESAKVGDSIMLRLGVKDNGPNFDGLTIELKVIFTAEEKVPTIKPGKPPKKLADQKETSTQAKAPPPIILIKEAEGAEFSFDESSGGVVTEGENGSKVYVYGGNTHYKQMLANESRDAERSLIEHRYKYGLGLLTLALHNRAVKLYKNEDSQLKEIDPEEFVRTSSSAIAPYVVSVIHRLGQQMLD